MVDAVACLTRRNESGRAERLILYAVPYKSSEHFEATLLDHLRQRLPEYMVPNEIHGTDTLPLTQTGKTDRRVMVAQDVARVCGASQENQEAILAALWTDPRQCAVAALIAKEVRQAVILPDQSLIDVVGDSLEALTIALEIEKQFGVSLDPSELLTDEPLGPIVARVCGA